MTKASQQTIFPVLVSHDALGVMAWLEDACGFSTLSSFKDERGRVYHAETARDGNAVMLAGKDDAPSAGPWARASFGVYVVVDDVDALYARAVAAEAEVVIPLADSPNGREFSLRDPEGMLWSFGTYRPDLALG